MVLVRHEAESLMTSPRTAEQSTSLLPVPSANVSVTCGLAVIEPEPDLIVITPLESTGLALITTEAPCPNRC